MAKSYKELEDVKPVLKDKDDPNDTFLSEMRDRFERCVDWDRDLRIAALEDMKFTFVPGNQWDSYATSLRRDRPCYEFNKVRQSVRQITGDQLQNRPGIKIRPTEEGDEDTAEVIEGIIRNIESVSHAERAYDNAFQFSCAGGYGVWRVVTDYRDQNDFDLDIFIKEVRNPFAAYCDPDAKEFDRRDAKFWFLCDYMGRKAFKQKYPDAENADFFSSNVGDQLSQWYETDKVRIAEYWYKEPIERTIYQLNDGRVVDAEDFDPHADTFELAGIRPVKQKVIQDERVMMEIVSGCQRLEGPFEWPGKYIPFVPVWGDILNVEGRDLWSGMVRFAKDAQRLFNFEQSTLVELVAKQPQQPFTGPAEAIKGYEKFYENLGDMDVPFLPYKVVADAPNGGQPQRLAGAVLPAAWANLSAMASDNIKATLGIYDASLGARSNETSGRAIMARQREGDVANFVYTDNLAKALKYTGEILVDLIPRVIDTERAMRILGQDGAQKWVTVNKAMQDPQTGEWVTVNDLSLGKYDVTVTTGPSYTTQRMEAADAAMQLSNNPGPFGMLMQYAFLKNSDFPNMDEVVAASRQFLVNQGLLKPGEGDTPPPPPQPNPSDVADADLKAAQAENFKAKTAQITATIPGQVAKDQASANEQNAKAVRNAADTHHAIEDRLMAGIASPPPLNTGLTEQDPNDIMPGMSPDPATPAVLNGGTY